MKILMVLTSHDQLGETGHKTGFYVGGHGPMWDLAESPVSIALLESFYNSGKPIALVCHSPGVLSHAKYQGVPLVKGKHVAGFTNGEEEEMQLTKADWQPSSVVDGLLVTGQNPASSTSSALALLGSLTVQKAA
jgi:putative intracellular protease/amidase